MGEYELKVRDHFDAAHYIQDYQGKCSRQHGHRWVVEAVLEGYCLDKLNMLVDFASVKIALKQLTDKLDHYQLNVVLGEPNVTAEYLAKWLYDGLGQLVDIRLCSVAVWESPDCCVVYYGE